jgi:hypothetical protein
MMSMDEFITEKNIPNAQPLSAEKPRHRSTGPPPPSWPPSS